MIEKPVVQNHPLCPLCRFPARYLFSAHTYPIFRCGNCGHRFFPPSDQTTHVDTVYDDGYFYNGLAGYKNYPAGKQALLVAGEYYARILNSHRPPGRLLDVGAAAGYILESFVAAGWDAIGIEPNQTMASLGRQRGLAIESVQIEKFTSESVFDAVTMIQVFPHFLDPQAVLDQCCSLLQAKGLLLIETWDRNSLLARLLGRHWHEYSPPSVLHWFSRASLDQIVERSGLSKVAQGRPPKRINIGHAVSLLRYMAGQSFFGRLVTAPLVLFPDRLQLPYFFDDVFWSLYKK